MEEVKNTEATATQPKMISEEEANNRMQSIIKQVTAQMNQMREQIQQLEAILRDKTTDHLFSVLKYAQYFEPEFVDKTADVLTKYLTSIAMNTQEEEQTVTPITTSEK